MRKLVELPRRLPLVHRCRHVFAVASTVFTIVGPKILGNATTKLFEGVMAQIAGTGTASISATSATSS